MIGEPLGSGGQGVVYLAQDTLLNRSVAIKFPADPDELTDRLLAEARAASKLVHPNIAHIYEAGRTPDGRLYVVMEYVEGESLFEALRRGPLPVMRAVEVMLEVLDALGEAHRQGVVHRDIKPSNIMLTARGGVKVLDFGLAKRFPTIDRSLGDEVTESRSAPVTIPGVVVGTTAYMSPEQLRGDVVDGRSDLFSCGIVLYESIAGRRPFVGTGIALADEILNHPAIPLPATEAAPGVAGALLRALQKSKEARFQTVSEMAAALRSPVASPPAAIREGWFSFRHAAFIVASILVLTPAGWWLSRPRESDPPPAAARWYQQGLEELRDGTWYGAARALESATRAEPGFALGHARLAEAWTELDSPEKAQRELLLAKRGAGGWRRRSPAVELTIAAIADIVLRDYTAAAGNYRRLLKEAAPEAQAGVWVDLGRAQDKANNSDAAVDSFTQAARLDPHHAAAWLLRGIVRGRKGKFALMEEDFKKAQAIYEAAGNREGQAELAYQRGRLATLAKDLPTARAALEHAIELAGQNDDFHQVRALTQLSIVTFYEGNAALAIQLSSQAVARARAARMPFLTAQSLVDLGSAHLQRLDVKSAEATLREAIALAQTDGLPRSEARARMTLGSVLVQAERDQEAIPEIDAAVAFYSKGQYPAEINMSRILLGRVNRRRGEFDKVQQILGDMLREAEAAGDKARVSDTVGEIANLYALQEKFPEALREFERRFEFVNASKTIADIGYSLTGKAAMLLRLGLLQQSSAALDEAEKLAGADEGVSRRVKLLRLDSLYRAGRWTACATGFAESEKENTPTVTGEIFSASRQIECLAFGNRLAEARSLAARSMARFRSTKNSQDAIWLQAVSALVAAEGANAGDLAHQAADYFRKRGQLESAWMAEASSAGALRRSGDRDGAASRARESMDLFQRLKARLGPEYGQTYASSPVVLQYLRQRS